MANRFPIILDTNDNESLFNGDDLLPSQDENKEIGRNMIEYTKRSVSQRELQK